MSGENRNVGRRTVRSELKLKTFLFELKNSQIVLFHQIDDGSDIF
jgi:hypothetical protein